MSCTAVPLPTPPNMDQDPSNLSYAEPLWEMEREDETISRKPQKFSGLGSHSVCSIPRKKPKHSEVARDVQPDQVGILGKMILH